MCLPYSPPTKVKQEQENNLDSRGQSLPLRQELWATDRPRLSKVFFYFSCRHPERYSSTSSASALPPCLQSVTVYWFPSLEDKSKNDIFSASQPHRTKAFSWASKARFLGTYLPAAFLWEPCFFCQGLRYLGRHEQVLTEGNTFSCFYRLCSLSLVMMVSSLAPWDWLAPYAKNHFPSW